MAGIPNLLPPNLQGISASPSTIGDQDRKKLGQDEFFRLMVTQLQNQDPMKPLESNEFLSQVAQFSTVSGIEDMQASISQLASSMQSAQALQASLLVGRDVLVPGSVGTFVPGSALKGAIELPVASANVQLEVFDAAGQRLRTIDLGSHPGGPIAFSWDGLTDTGTGVGEGVYSVRASALVDGQKQAVGTLVQNRVDSVTLNNSPGGLTLNLKNLGAIDVGQVRELL